MMNNIKGKIFLPQMEEQQKEVLRWIGEILGEPLDDKPFAEVLRDGIVLCRLLNKVSKSDVRYTESKQLFVQRENITSFINGLRQLGLNEYELFQTNDLFEEKNLKLVVISLYALSRHLQKTGAIGGPFIGPQLPKGDKLCFTQDRLGKTGLNEGNTMGYNARSGMYVGVETKNTPKRG
jgi:transgelin